MEKIKIDIVSDVVCPWCIVGYKRLEKALEQLSDRIEADIQWHPFELNPQMVKEGEDLREHIIRKYGSTKEDSDRMRSHLQSIGEGLGFDFNYKDDSRIYNTFKAHQLLHWAQAQGQKPQTDLKLALFEAAFTQGADVSEDDVLLNAVEKAGLDRDEAAAVLADERFADTVRAVEHQWHQSGVQAVPSVVFNQKYLVSGAQETATLVDVIEQVLEQDKA